MYYGQQLLSTVNYKWFKIMQYDGIKGTKLRVQIWCKARLHKVQNCGVNNCKVMVRIWCKMWMQNGKKVMVMLHSVHMVQGVGAKWWLTPDLLVSGCWCKMVQNYGTE